MEKKPIKYSCSRAILRLKIIFNSLTYSLLIKGDKKISKIQRNVIPETAEEIHSRNTPYTLKTEKNRFIPERRPAKAR